MLQHGRALGSVLRRDRVGRGDARRVNDACLGLARDAFGRSWRMGGGWRRIGAVQRRLRGHSRRNREDRSSPALGGRPGLGPYRGAEVADASGVPRGWRPSRRGRGLDPPSAATQPAPRTFERGRRAKILQNEPTFRDSRGCPPGLVVVFDTPNKRRLDLPAGVPRHFAAPPAANTRRRDAGASRGKLRDERHAVLRVHGGRILRHKRAAAGAPSGGTRIDESRRVAIPTRANNTNTPNPPHASHPQGRNDVRDAKADVTDVRAPGRRSGCGGRTARSTWRLRTRSVSLVDFLRFSSFVCVC